MQLPRSRFFSRLPAYGLESEETDSAYYFNDMRKLVKQIDFQFADGTEGSAFIVTRITSIFSKTFLLDMFLAIIFILVLTAMVLTQWIHKDVFAPINRLNLAMQKIAEGNFDYMLESEDDNEIGELYRNYEDMRLRLKESTEEKIQNEKQNRELISNITHDLKTRSRRSRAMWKELSTVWRTHRSVGTNICARFTKSERHGSADQ